MPVARQGASPLPPGELLPHQAPESPPLRGPVKGPGSAAWLLGEGDRRALGCPGDGRVLTPSGGPLDSGSWALHEKAEGEARR